MIARPTTWTALLATLALVTLAPGAHAQRIGSVSPQTVTLAPGEEARIMVSGEGLETLVTALVEERGLARKDVVARATPSRDGRSLVLTLAADRSARAGEGLEVVLAPREPRRASPPVSVPMRLSVEVPPPPEPAFEPVTVDTRPLVMTGLRFLPVVLDTPTLRMTGRRFVPVVLDTPTLRMTGRRFVPVVLDTPTLRMTGLREEEVPQ